jgi:hypothetical protein
MKDAILIIWLILATAFNFLVVGFTGYLVFWRDHSGWWFIVAITLCYQPTLIAVLKKKFEIEEENE